MLAEQGLGVQSAKVITEILFTNDSFCKLSLPKNALGDSGARIISEALSKVQNIISLDLSCNLITPLGGLHIFRAVKYSQSIISLDLSSQKGLNRNTLGATGVAPLRDILVVNKFLSYLNLSGNFIGDEGVKHICAGLINGEN